MPSRHYCGIIYTDRVLLLANRQNSSLCKASANRSSANIKLSKQISEKKTICSKFLGDSGTLGKATFLGAIRGNKKRFSNIS